MSYLTETTLRSYKSDLAMKRGAPYVRENKSQAQVSVFLSHSHLDRDLVEGLILLLATEAGMTIYVDWQDSTMPRITSGATADAIKGRIKELDRFVILATNNALRSRWVPWEIGVADCTKQRDDILIVPVADATGQFLGNEYLQLYQHLELEGTYKTPAIFRPSQSYSTKRLSEWLKKGNGHYYSR